MQQPSRIEAAFDSFDQFKGSVVRSDLTTRATASKIDGRYRAAFSPYQTSTALRKLQSGDVALLFRAADAAFFYTVSRARLDDLQLDLAELRRRGAAHDDNYQEMYAALVESRSFHEAGALAKLHPVASIEAVPSVADTVNRSGATTLIVRDGGTKLERKPIDLNHSALVVIASPLCHFCQRAIRSIEKDAVLRTVFRDHARWIVPPDQSTPFSTVAEWNRIHPHEQMEFAYRREDWPMVQRWETPVFYFFKDGRVVGTVSGWPVAGRKTEIRHSMRLAGLM